MRTISNILFCSSLIMVFGIMLTSSCKKDDNPTESPDNDSATVIATAFIGSSGGTIINNEIILKIPEGVFSENREIKIIRYKTNVFENAQAGSAYRITGFPQPITGSFYLAVAHNGELSGNNYLALGSSMYIKSLNDTAIDFSLYQIKDSSGFFTTYINPVNKKNGHNKNILIDLNDHDIVVIPVTKYCETLSSASHFRLLYPCSVPSAHITALAKALEDAYNLFLDPSFGFAYAIPTTNPMKVLVRSFKANLFLGYFGNDPDIYGLYERSGFFSTANDGQILINTDKVINEELMKVTAGHEFFHFVQDNYNTGGELKNWITEATAPWTEELFSSDKNYVPDVTLQHYFRPFLGMQAGVNWVDVTLNNTKNSSFHGYGMSALVKYFVDNCGLVEKRQIIYNMIMAIHNDIHPVEAFMNSAEPTVNGKILWQSFFKQYILNNIYHSSKTSASLFLTGEFYDITDHAYKHPLTDPNISFITYSTLFPDLSAKLYRFDLNRSFEKDDKLVFSTSGGLTGDVKMSVFKFRTLGVSNTIEFLNDGTGISNETTVNDIKTIKDSGYGILVLVTNSHYEAPYTGETEITLEVNISNGGLPLLTTNPVTNVSLTSAISGGHVIKQGSSPVLVRGLCWNTDSVPTIMNNHSIDGADTGSFTTSMTGLIPLSKYYIRAYATNSAGTAYGNEISFTLSDCGAVTDIEGNTYNAIKIGSQCWMSENLKTSKYRNSEDITLVTNDSTWESLTSGAWCFYNNDAGNNAVYGKLYNWYAVTNSNELCPTGWHVPTNDEWLTLTNYLINSGYGYEGSGMDIAKSMATTSGWKTNSILGAVGNNQSNNNNSGFTGLPGGYRVSNGVFFDNGDQSGNWWSSTEQYGGMAWYRALVYDSPFVHYYSIQEAYGYSVRCLKD